MLRASNNRTVASFPAAVTGDAYYVHTDHLGTPQKLTDETQTVVWDAVYQPFGQVTIPTELVTYNQRFPGQYFDTETGLHYNYFRDYDAMLGRYIESDPIGLRGGINTYGYSLQNPVVNYDPNGEAALLGPVGRIIFEGLVKLGVRYKLSEISANTIILSGAYATGVEGYEVGTEAYSRFLQNQAIQAKATALQNCPELVPELSYDSIERDRLRVIRSIGTENLSHSADFTY